MFCQEDCELGLLLLLSVLFPMRLDQQQHLLALALYHPCTSKRQQYWAQRKA